jgi:DnaJ-class molecular chaperone
VADGFDDVFGSAIARAVRRAVDGVGREPEAPASDLPAVATADPYELLGVSRRAQWSEIAAAYKARARAWHPDGAPAEEQERRHELLRELNAAYAELRVRRGR